MVSRKHMSTNSYPPLRLAVLNGLLTLKEQVEADPDYLKGSDYDGETISILERLFSPKIIEKPVERIIHVAAKAGRGRPSKDVQLDEEDEIKIRDEIRKLLTALDTMEVDEKLEVQQKLAITKNKRDLLESVLKMRERETTVRKTEEFKETIIGILQDLIDEKDRETFMKRLEALR